MKMGTYHHALWVLALLAPVLGCENCETSSLLQRAEITEARSLSLGLGEAGTVSFSSPEFLKLLPSVDGKMNPIAKPNTSREDCLRMVKALAKPHTTMKRPSLIHTGVIIPEGAGTIPGWRDAARKLRLLPMSFLATQDLENTKLQFWTQTEASHPLIEEIFSPIMKKYGNYIEIKKFDVAAEFAKASRDKNLTAELVKTFNSLVQPSSKSDLMRYAVLYNYGGAWMDSDVLLVQDLSPILGEDWAELMYGNWVNQATLSVSEPGSPFARACLSHILSKYVDQRWGAYGPTMMTRMVRDFQSSVAAQTFHVLPFCFFEGAMKNVHFQDQLPSKWDKFFVPEKNSTRLEQKRNYIAPHLENRSTFGYHWHNRWDVPMGEGSTAQAAEALYCEQLGIALN